MNDDLKKVNATVPPTTQHLDLRQVQRALSAVVAGNLPEAIRQLRLLERRIEGRLPHVDQFGHVTPF